MKRLLFIIFVFFAIGTTSIFAQSNTNSASGDDKTSQRTWFDSKTGNQCFSFTGVTSTISWSNAGTIIIRNDNSYRVTVIYTSEDGKRTGVVTLAPKGQEGQSIEVRGVVSLKQSVLE
ncbi:MAG: hypothetical protein LBI40_03930 [Treponema sp.]|jgi:hypothetical protein|nr:hypothetical protein [Treponema sp.]